MNIKNIWYKVSYVTDNECFTIQEKLFKLGFTWGSYEGGRLRGSSRSKEICISPNKTIFNGESIPTNGIDIIEINLVDIDELLDGV